MLEFSKRTCEEFKILSDGKEVLSTKSRIDAENFYIRNFNRMNPSYAIIRENYMVKGIRYKVSRFFIVLLEEDVVYKAVPCELEEAIEVIKDLNEKRSRNLRNGDDALQGVFVAVYPKNNKYVMEDPIKHKRKKTDWKVREEDLPYSPRG